MWRSITMSIFAALVIRANVSLAQDSDTSTVSQTTQLVQAGPEETGPDNIPGEIEVSGFFDVVASAQASNEDETQFDLGQAEIDLARQLSNLAEIQVAVVYDNESENFELGAAFVDLELFNRRESDPATATGFPISRLNLLLGQFDVPFGIDYHVYPSIERKLVTAPLAVDLTHGGWNDYGIQLGVESQHANLVCYWVNGFASSAEVLDVVQTLATGTEVYEEIDTSPANAFGSRLGIKPLGWLEIGSSVAAGWNASGKDEMVLLGADLQLALGDFGLKGEYISHSLNRSVAKEDNRGYYLEADYRVFGDAFVVGRYGAFKPDSETWDSYGSLGAGYAIADQVEVRCETTLNERSADNQTLFQIVAGF